MNDVPKEHKARKLLQTSLSVVLVYCVLGVGISVAVAALTLNATTIVSDSGLSITANGSSTFDVGSGTLSMQTTNNGPITFGNGLVTLGGNLTVSGTESVAGGTWAVSATGTLNAGNIPITRLDGTNQTAVNTSFLGPNGDFMVPGLILTQVYSGNIASGDVDVYTVPAGKRATFVYGFFNPTTSSITQFPEVKISGTYYRTAAASTIASKAALGSQTFNFLWLEAGDSFSFNVTATSGLNIYGTAYVIPNTSPLKSARVTSFSVGNNTIHTVPAGKRGYPQGFSLFYGVSGGNGVTGCFNNTGSSRNWTMYDIPNGQGSSTNTQILSNSALADKTSFSGVTSMIEEASDSIVLNTDSNSSGQFCYHTVIEQ